MLLGTSAYEICLLTPENQPLLDVLDGGAPKGQDTEDPKIQFAVSLVGEFVMLTCLWIVSRVPLSSYD